MGDVVAGDVQNLPVIGHAPDDDVAVRVKHSPTPV
jgi:hypothetical protein